MKLILMAFSVVLLIACSEDSAIDKVEATIEDVQSEAAEMMEKSTEAVMEETEEAENEMKEARAQGTKNRVPEAYSTLTMEG